MAERESTDGTVKAQSNHRRRCFERRPKTNLSGQVAYGLPDGHAIESVLMPYQETWRTMTVGVLSVMIVMIVALLREENDNGSLRPNY